MFTNPSRKSAWVAHAVLTLTFLWVAANVLRAQTVSVDSASNFTSTDIFATGGEVFEIEATGIVDLAVPDGYKTNPDGRILTAPAAGTGAYQFFQQSALPIGVAPAAGARKLVRSKTPLPMRLTARFSPATFRLSTRSSVVGMPRRSSSLARLGLRLRGLPLVATCPSSSTSLRRSPRAAVTNSSSKWKMEGPGRFPPPSASRASCWRRSVSQAALPPPEASTSQPTAAPT